MMTLFSALPVPLRLPLPSSVRFSTLAPSVKLMLEHTVSVPAAAFSDDRVAGIIDEVGIVAAPPVMVSAPAPPSSTLLPALPVMTLFRLLPMPLMLPLPVSVRFSTLARA